MATNGTQTRHTNPLDAAATALRYHRLSGEKGADEKQDSRTSRLARGNGATVLGTYADDEITAAYDPQVDDGPEYRAGFEALLADVAKLRPTYIVALYPSRFVRNLEDWARLERACARAGTLILTERGCLDVRNQTHRAMGAMQAMQDAQYVAAISEGLASTLADRRELGKPRFGGVRPYGFKADRVTPCPREAAVVRWLAERVLAGDSLASLARALNDNGTTPPVAATANPKHADKRKRDVGAYAWTTSTVKSLLRRPSTCGWLAHKGELVREFAAVESGKVEPILDRELWQRVVDKLAKRSASPGGRSPLHGSYFLSRLLRCGAPTNGKRTTTCGAQMFGSLVTRANGSQVRKYRCERGHTAILANDIETYAREVVLTLGSDPRHMHALADAAEARSLEWRDADDAVTRLERELDQLAHGVDEDGHELSPRFAAKRAAVVERDLAAAERRRSGLDSTPADALERLQAQARDNLARAWAAAESSPDKRRAMVATVVSGFRILPSGRGKRSPADDRVEVLERV